MIVANTDSTDTATPLPDTDADALSGTVSGAATDDPDASGRVARADLVRAGRLAGISDEQLAITIGVTTRTLRRSHGPRSATLRAARAPHDEPPADTTPDTPADRQPVRVQPASPAPNPRHPRRQRPVSELEERLGNRIDSGDLPWSGEHLRAATHRRLQQVASERAIEYGVPFVVVTTDLGESFVAPASDYHSPDFVDGLRHAPDAEPTTIFHR
jgi:hypothetical protein